MLRRSKGLTVLCCLLDASLILWCIWTQPHQIKPGGAEALAADGRPRPAHSASTSPQTHHEGITIFMLSVTGIRGLGRDGRKGLSRRDEETTAESKSSPWGPLPAGRACV